MLTTPAFRLYAQDFYFGVVTFNNTTVGAYLKLLIYQWDRGFVPDDIAQIARIIAEPLRVTRQVWADVKCKFERDAHGHWKNRRMERERAKLLEYRNLQAEKGAKGGRQRAANRLAAATARL